ncbi:MAG TPA: thioredoxin [Candidatus Dojkabacteria bacterium]|nr:thioredoxin [Candidatus Dojkabacteria bacterium]
MADLAVTDSTFQESVHESKGLVMVDFWAAWCMPCLMLGPIIEEIAHEKKDVVKVMKLNVDENPETSMKYQVMSIPTVILFKDGKPVQTFIGVQPKAVYERALEVHAGK